MRAAILFALLTSIVFASGGPVPRKAPFFQVQVDEKRGLALSQFSGKAVVVAFVMSSCDHCEFTAALLNRIQKDYGDRVQVIASIIDDMAAIHLDAFVKKISPVYPVGYNNLATAVNFMGYGPGVQIPLPIVMFIDGNGVIREQFDSKDKEMTDEANQDKNIRLALDRTIKAGGTPARIATSPAASRDRKTP